MNTQRPYPSAISAVATRKPHRLLASALLPLVLGFVSAASATDVVFSSAGYTISAETATLSMSNVENESSYNSGTLRMELWALDSPWTGASSSIQSGYRLAVSPSLGTLDADSRFTTSPITVNATYLSPPAGSYYVTMFLSEYQGGSFDDGYEVVDYVNFQIKLSAGQAGVSNGTYFGFDTAISVGQGYFYDSDLGYMYPFGDGWVYLSDLDKYIYVNHGDEFTSGIYLYDLTRSSWTYTEQSFWPYVYYFDGTGWVDTGLD